MITIEEVQRWADWTNGKDVFKRQILNKYELVYLAISQHEDIENLKREYYTQHEEIGDLKAKLDKYTRRSESGESLGDAIDMAEEIERLRDLVHNFAAFVERQAFKIPAPNPYTPAFLEGVVTARNAAIEIKSGEPK